MSRNPGALAILATVVGIAWLGVPDPLRADGWHNASLASASLDEWMAELKTVVPEFEQKFMESKPEAEAEPEKPPAQPGPAVSNPPQNPAPTTPPTPQSGGQPLNYKERLKQGQTPADPNMKGGKNSPDRNAPIPSASAQLVPGTTPPLNVPSVKSGLKGVQPVPDKTVPLPTTSVPPVPPISPPPPKNPAPSQPPKASKSKFTPEEQALLGRKASDCLEIMAYMDTRNILPHEFPNFPLNKIPEYRKAAKQLLYAMGPTGGTAIANQLRAELMGATLGGFDVTLTDSYYSDLFEVLQTAAASGHLPPADLTALQEACPGQKPAPQANLARKVESILSEHVSLATLLEWAKETDDNRRKQAILNQAKKRLSDASPEELLEVLQQPDLEAAIRTSIENQLTKGLTEAPVLELLGLMESQSGNRLGPAAAAELAKRSPTYADVQKQVPQIWEFAASADQAVAAAARRQVTNAFQRAPMSHCLHYLGQGEEPLKALIWQQVDARIQRADAQTKAGYSQTALALVINKDEAVAKRAAALELLSKLKDLRDAGALIDALPTLPRELWPPAGATLQTLTGQDFGPQAGAGVAEVGVALKKWREWWKVNGRP